jgi:radical SAM superfamily enzyme YgiQ (UPF0313 family)
MRVCLISAPTANDFDNKELAELDSIRTIAEHSPLGILSLAAVLEQQGVEQELVDLNRLYYDYLRSDGFRQDAFDFCGYASQYFEQKAFDVYGFSTICSSYPLTLRIATEVKRAHPDANIVLGGPQASVVDRQTMQAFDCIDFVVRGEAEQSFPMLLNSLSGTHSSGEVPGVTFRRGNEIVRGPSAPVIQDLDDLPFPAFHLYPYMKGAGYIPLELGRGCPFACTFCSTNDFFRRRFRLKTPAHMISEMRKAKETYGLNQFDLVHDMFTVDRKRVVAFCEELLKCQEKFFWGCSARTDCIDDELIALMAKAGCRGIFFGIETGSARMQKIVDKGLDLPEAKSRIKCTDKYKIKTAVSLITGFPEETMQDLEETVEFFLSSMRYDYADPQLCLLAPLAETPIQTQHKDELICDDIISDMSFQGWNQDTRDRELIQKYPDIFPNFYSVPTPYLDRKFLKELREFILNGMGSFRWLFVGLHQDSGNLLTVFTLWRNWRQENKGAFPEGNIASYYANLLFRREFVEFVRSRYLDGHARAPVALRALLDYDASFLADTEENRSTAEQDVPSDLSVYRQPIGMADTPELAKGIRVTKLEVDYRKIVQCLRRQGRLDRVPARTVSVVTRPTVMSVGSRTEIVQLTELSAQLMALCDGKRTVADIVHEFGTDRPEIDGVPVDKVCRLGLELLRQQHLVTVRAAASYLPQLEASATQPVFAAAQA